MTRKIYSSIGRIERHQGKWTESIAHLEKAVVARSEQSGALAPPVLMLRASKKLRRRGAKRSTGPSPWLRIHWISILHRAFLQMFWKGDLSWIETVCARLQVTTSRKSFTPKSDSQRDIAAASNTKKRRKSCARMRTRVSHRMAVEPAIPKSLLLGRSLSEQEKTR